MWNRNPRWAGLGWKRVCYGGNGLLWWSYVTQALQVHACHCALACCTTLALRLFASCPFTKQVSVSKPDNLIDVSDLPPELPRCSKQLDGWCGWC